MVAGVAPAGAIAAVSAVTWLVSDAMRALSSSLVGPVGAAMVDLLRSSDAARERVMRMIGSEEEILKADQCPE